MNPVFEDLVKQYEEQQANLSSMLHIQAHYIEEMITKNITQPLRIPSKSDLNNEFNQSNLSLNSTVFLRNHSGRRRDFGGTGGPKSTETNKSKSVTRYQNIDDEI